MFSRKKPAMRSLVRKYVVLCVSVILAGLVLFAAILLAFSKDYIDKETESVLTRNALLAAEYTGSNLSVSNTDELNFDAYRIREGFYLVTNRPGYSMFFTDDTGKILMYIQSGDGSDLDVPQENSVSSEIISQITSSGIFQGSGKMNDLYNNNHMLVGVPVTVNGDIVGYIFCASSLQELQSFLMNMLEIFILGAIAVLAFTFTMITIGTDRFMQPLKDMSAATIAFSEGDFSRRVPVDPNSYDEMNQLSIAFNNMASALAAHEKSSRNFVANVSHELKTPMTTIGGFIDGILDGTIPPEQEEHYLTIVSDEVKRLSRLVVSMLNLSRMESGEVVLNPTTFDIGNVVVQIVLTFERRISEKKLDVKGLENAHDFFVETDLDMIHQVIYNLVDNAVKFASIDGYLEFTFLEDQGMIYVSIKNSGDGINKEEIQQVFDRFYKTDKSRSLDKSGVGLGLYIVKSIMNTIHGDITVRSVIGEFCEFTVAIPAASKKAKTSMQNNDEIRE